jgi:RNase P subunit RPR2
MSRDEDLQFAVEKLKRLASGKPKEVILSNAEKAGFLIQCLKCGSKLIAIFPSRTEEGEGVIFSCLKCDNVLCFGIDAERPVMKGKLGDDTDGSR